MERKSMLVHRSRACVVFVLAAISAYVAPQVSAADSCALTSPRVGIATYHMYELGQDDTTRACQSPFRLASNGKLMVTAISEDFGLDGGLACGDCILVTNTMAGGGLSAVVEIVDLKGAFGLDMSPDSFNSIAGGTSAIAKGSMDISYVKVPCTSIIGNGKIRYRYKAGSDAKPYLGFMIIDHLLPVKAVAVSDKKDGVYKDCKMSAGAKNWWMCTDHAAFDTNGGGPIFYVKMTASTGQTIVDEIRTISSFDESVIIPSYLGVQFSSPSGSACGGTSGGDGGSTSNNNNNNNNNNNQVIAPPAFTGQQPKVDPSSSTSTGSSTASKLPTTSMGTPFRPDANSTTSGTEERTMESSPNDLAPSTAEKNGSKPVSCLAKGSWASSDSDANSWCATNCQDGSCLSTVCSCGTYSQSFFSSQTPPTCTATGNPSDPQGTVADCGYQCLLGRCLPSSYCTCSGSGSGSGSGSVSALDSALVKDSEGSQNGGDGQAGNAAAEQSKTSSSFSTASIIISVIAGVAVLGALAAFVVLRARRNSADEEEFEDSVPSSMRNVPYLRTPPARGETWEPLMSPVASSMEAADQIIPPSGNSLIGHDHHGSILSPRMGRKTEPWEVL